MTRSHLKSTTTLLISMALAFPAPVFAQTAEAPFPCIAPSGEEVSDAEALAASMATFAAAGAEASAAATCLAETVAAAAPPMAEETAPEVVLTETPVEPAQEPEPAAPEVTEVAPAPEAVAEEGAVEETAQVPAPEVVIEEATEMPALAEPELAPETVEQETPAADTAEVEPVAETPAEPAAKEPVALEVEDPDPVVGAVEEPQADAVELEKPAEPAAEVSASAEGNEAEAEIADGEPEQVGASEPDPEITAETAQAPASEESTTASTEVGEAGSDEMTDEERQQISLERDAATVASAAAAAETTDAEPAEVVTKEITEEEVRKSDEDFQTNLTASATAETQASGGDRSLSNFEKALLLGLGAAVVGSVLNNGDQVVANSGDRVVVERDGELRVLKNDDQLLQRPGAQVQTQTFQDGSTRTVVTYEDNSQIITVRASDGTVLRRAVIRASDGQEVVLFDDTQTKTAVDFAELPSLETLQAEQAILAGQDNIALNERLQRALLADVGRTFTLQQVRDFKRVRALAPQIELNAVTFASGSAAIERSQAEALRDLALSMRALIADNPGAVFLVEGHTDAVGAASYNLALSDRRAETVALALTEYFGVPPQNLITQGYGESDLKLQVLSDERANRRAVVRNISLLLQ